MDEPLAEADSPQQLLGARPRLGHRHPGDAHRHLGVLERVELGQQVMKLEDEANLPVAECDDLGIRQRRQFRLADPDGAAIGAIEATEHVQQRALPHARRADDGHHLPGVDTEIEIAQHGQRRLTDGIALDDAARFEKRHVKSQVSSVTVHVSHAALSVEP